MPYEIKDKDGISYLVDDNVPKEEAEKFIQQIPQMNNTTSDIDSQAINRLVQLIQPKQEVSPPVITPYGAVGSGKAINELMNDLRYNYQEMVKREQLLKEEERQKRLEEIENQRLQLEELRQRHDKLMAIYNFVNTISQQRRQYQLELAKEARANREFQHKMEMDKLTYELQKKQHMLQEKRLQLDEQKEAMAQQYRNKLLEISKQKQDIDVFKTIANIIQYLEKSENKNTDILSNIFANPPATSANLSISDETLKEYREKSNK